MQYPSENGILSSFQDRARTFLTLFFFFLAYDLVLYAEASEEQIKIAMECLNQFNLLSGHKIIMQKSSIFFSKDVESTLGRKISSILEIQTTATLKKYLGTPSITGRVHTDLYQGLVERIESKMEGWTTKHLSLARRNVLSLCILCNQPSCQ